LGTANLAGIIIAFDGAMSQELKWERKQEGKDGVTMSYETYPDNSRVSFKETKEGALELVHP
jgi:hypothetical protein